MHSPKALCERPVDGRNVSFWPVDLMAGWMNEWLRWREDIAFDMTWGLNQSWKKYQNSNFQSSWKSMATETYTYSEPSLVGRISLSASFLPGPLKTHLPTSPPAILRWLPQLLPLPNLKWLSTWWVALMVAGSRKKGREFLTLSPWWSLAQIPERSCFTHNLEKPLLNSSHRPPLLIHFPVFVIPVLCTKTEVVRKCVVNKQIWHLFFS